MIITRSKAQAAGMSCSEHFVLHPTSTDKSLLLELIFSPSSVMLLYTDTTLSGASVVHASEDQPSAKLVLPKECKRYSRGWTS